MNGAWPEEQFAWSGVEPWDEYSFTDDFADGTAPFYGTYASMPLELVAAAEQIAAEFVSDHAPPQPPLWAISGGHDFTGWSQPPRPADVVVSFNPHASKRDQARAVLYDYYHDDPLRYWSDNEAVKRCFIGGPDPRKEDHDPLLLISAYENKNHKIWQCHGTGMSWNEMNDAVQQAIAHRRKLGSLPKSSYDTDPIVIYYYDNDKMKRISYPLAAVPYALNVGENRWWAAMGGRGGDQSDAGKDAGKDDTHTLETDDPNKIALERKHPGWTKGTKDKKGSAGGWSDEGFSHDKDVAGTGAIGTITGAILALVSAVLDVTGVGAVIGVPLGVATPFIVSAINAADTALHVGDFGAAMANLGPALVEASVKAGMTAAGAGAGAAGFNIPPAALKALGNTISSVAKTAIAGQKKQSDFGQIWAAVAAKAGSYGKIGDEQAEAIATMLGGPKGESKTAGHVFLQGYLAGKFLDMKALAAIGKLLQAYATFADPRIINIALLGMGIGHVARTQQGGFAASGEFVGQDLATKQYGPMSQAAISSLLARAQAAGLAVSGSNPWTIDTHEHGVKLSVSWDPTTGATSVSVTDKYPYVSNAQIWERIDALAGASMTHVTGAMLSPRDKLHAFVQFRLVPRYTKHATSGPYDIADDIHQDERIEAAQGLLNQLRGAKPGDVLFLSSTGILDAPTREAMRSFQFEAGVGSYDGMPTTETLLALEAEVQRKQAIFAGEYVTGVGFDTHVPAGTLIYDGPNGHPISMIADDARAMFIQRLGHWLQLDIDGTHVWVQETAIDHASGEYFAGQTSLTPPPDYGALSRGCPLGSWWDPFTSTCRAATAPPMPPKPQPMPGPPNPMPLPVSPEMPTPTVSGRY